MTRLMRPPAIAAILLLPLPALMSAQAPPRVSPPARPQYERTLRLESSSETSANVSIGDVNGDGNPDMVLAKGRHWPLVDRVLLGDGRGGFPTAYDLGTASDRSYSGHLVDLDGDGDLDVVISNDRPDPKLVYLNDGTGRFRPGSTCGQADWPTRNATRHRSQWRRPPGHRRRQSHGRPARRQLHLLQPGGAAGSMRPARSSRRSPPRRLPPSTSPVTVCRISSCPIATAVRVRFT